MVDSHCHLGLCEADPDELVAEARRAGVGPMLTVGIDEASNAEAVATAEAHAEVLAAVGRHPNAAAGFDSDDEAAIRELALHPRVRAVGETGLDYYRRGAPRADQRRAFAAQIGLAHETGLPLVIHARDGPGDDGDAVGEVFETLAVATHGVTVILHCFSAGPERATEAAERGWYCSFAGNVTYPRAERLREAARRVPDELLLLETDSPFLAPQAVRGRPNQPARVVSTAEAVAAERGISYARLEEITDANAARVLGC